MTRAHRSFRLPPEMLDRLDERARVVGQTTTRLAERYLEEGLRTDAHPGIVFRDGPAGRRASVAGTGLDVWEVIRIVEANGGSIVDAAAYLESSEPVIRAAARYYADHPQEIEEQIADDARLYQREVAALRRVADRSA